MIEEREENGLELYRMLSASRIFKYVWAARTTALGLLIVGATILTTGGISVSNGVMEAHGRFAAFFLRRVTGLTLQGGAAALTLGHVVIGRDLESLERTRAHELVHVKQCELWGPFFVPAYLLASAVAWLQRKDAYRDNRFEREAYLKARL